MLLFPMSFWEHRGLMVLVLRRNCSHLLLVYRIVLSPIKRLRWLILKDLERVSGLWRLGGQELEYFRDVGFFDLVMGLVDLPNQDEDSLKHS